MNIRYEESEIILSSLFNSFKNWNGYLSSPSRHNWKFIKYLKKTTDEKEDCKSHKKSIVCRTHCGWR